MTTIYLIRHAEAEGNLYRRAHGQYNSLITDNGYRQICALSERLKDTAFDAVWSSDLFRTMTTSRSITDRSGQTLNLHKGLRELDMGDWEDKTWGELLEQYPQGMDDFGKSNPDFVAPNGEGFVTLTNRIASTITEIATEHPDKTIAIFCHGLAIRQFLSQIEQLDPTTWKDKKHGDNTAVSKLNWDGNRFKIEFQSDNSHLTDEISTFAQQTWWREGSGGIAAEKKLCFEPATQSSADFVSQCISEIDFKVEVGHAQIFTALENGNPVGALAVTPNTGEITLFYLSKSHQNMRLGVQLLGLAVSQVRKAKGEWLTVNIPSQSSRVEQYFTSYGFKRNEHSVLAKYIGYTPRKTL